MILRYLLTPCLVCWTMMLSAQIDMSDSTAQIIAYWQEGDSVVYQGQYLKVVTDAGDTTERKSYTYDLSIKIVDSTGIGYVTEWRRGNYRFDGYDELERDIVLLQSLSPVVVLTNEYGSDPRVINWEDIQTAAQIEIDSLQARYSGRANIQVRANKLRLRYADQDQVSLHAARDITQYLTFHGAKYKLAEVLRGTATVPNNYGGDPLQTNTVMYLDLIDPGRQAAILRFHNLVNPQQLKAVTYDYLSAQNIDAASWPSYEDFPDMKNDIWGGAEIHTSTGWVIYCIESNQVVTGNSVSLEEYSLNIKS